MPKTVMCDVEMCRFNEQGECQKEELQISEMADCEDMESKEEN